MTTDKDELPELQSIWDDAKGLIERGEFDKAIEIYKYVLIRYADNTTAAEYANAYLGDIFLTTRQLDLAQRYLKKALSFAPKKAHYHYLLGFVYSIKEEWTKSVAEFKKAIKLDSKNGEYERGLGWAMFNGGDRIEGIGHLYRALELSPSNIHAMTDLAGALLMLGNFEKAREYGEKALSLDSGYTPAHDLLKMIDRIEKR
ncbi:tetratricopeptide repeat protein [Chloroflexota bacterium]